jgi:hypothetical protein
MARDMVILPAPAPRVIQPCRHDAIDHQRDHRAGLERGCDDPAIWGNRAELAVAWI